MTRRVVVDLSPRVFEALRVLARADELSGVPDPEGLLAAEVVAEVLVELGDRVADGVHRPGSWERAWLVQAFGDEFEQRLEQDPGCEWYQRPRRSS